MSTTEAYAHRACTFILSDGNTPKSPRAPRWMRDRTHGCWCSSWRMTRNGMRIWRRGAWRKPKPGELRRVRGKTLERLKLVMPWAGQ